MKTAELLLKLSLVMIIFFGFTSCGTYEILNKAQVTQDVGYPSGKLPFRMATSDLFAPSFSKKGQVYADGDFGNGIGTGLAVAVGDRSFITSHWNFYSNITDLPSDSTYVEADYTYTYYESFYNWYTLTEDTAGVFAFSRDHELQSNNLEFGYGQYKTWENQLRNEWIVGTGMGKTSNTYSYSMLSNTIDFKEHRKFVNFYFQDDFAWVHKNLEATVIGRFNTYYFTNRTFDMDFWHHTPDYQKTAHSMEGSFRLSAGFHSVKAYLQVTGTLPIASPEIEWTPVQFKGGVMMRFGRAN